MNFRFSLLPLLAIMLGAMGFESAPGHVSPMNANFYIGYTDIIYEGGFETKIERVYNSMSIFRGMYGAGWGTEIEAYIEIVGDGVAVLHEYGGGAENRF